MRKIIGATLLVMLSAVGCAGASEEPAADEVPFVPASSAPAFDREAEQLNAWQMSVDTYPAQLKIDICDAASEGGAGAVEAFLTGDDMPFVVDNPAYEAEQWAKYCAG